MSHDFEIFPSQIPSHFEPPAMCPKSDKETLRGSQADHFGVLGDHFGFIVSDFLYPATKKYRPTPLGTFLRTDLGDEPSDHHTFFMLAIPADEPGELDHCAFEVRDYDDVAEGHWRCAAR